MKYECALFDLDGTLLDTLTDLQNSVNAALTQFDFPTRTYNEIRCFVGHGVKKLIERSLPPYCSAPQCEQVFQFFMQHYKHHLADHTKAYDGVLAMLQKLQQANVRVAIVSNKADAAVQDLCQHYFDGLYLLAVGAKENVRKKPYPDAVNQVMQSLSAQPDKTVYIGDSEVDIETAQNAGIRCISVAWGFRTSDELSAARAETIVTTPQEILDLIL
ncbi:MAG: HAD-IIIA family hydrolase [Clostridiales bacterium]|nr:HAD-IIIA family hydrolase [Clostridiales bacterium]